MSDSIIYGALSGTEAFILARQLANAAEPLLFIARDDARAQTIADILSFLTDKKIVAFPAWDCLPYDRVSPKADVLAERMDALWSLAKDPPAIVIAPVAAVMQRVVPRSLIESGGLFIKTGGTLALESFQDYLARHGYQRTSLVREPGEYAIRGGLIDLFPVGREQPVRIDLFGNDVEKIQTFDPVTQITSDTVSECVLKPASEILFDQERLTHFQNAYRREFGNVGDKDPLYITLSEGRPYPGMEHWLPLFYSHLESLFDYAAFGKVVLDHQLDLAIQTQCEQIHDFYQARLAFKNQQTAVYHPLPPERLYLADTEWRSALKRFDTAQLQPFDAPDEGADAANARPLLNLAEIRASDPTKLFDRVVEIIKVAGQDGRTTLIAAYSQGSASRLSHVLQEHGLDNAAFIENWADHKRAAAHIAILPIEQGFITPDLLVLSEQDILGDRLTRAAKKRSSKKFLNEVTALQPGDLIVHEQHGIGRFDSLETLTVAGAPHDCLRLIYDGGDRLFVPVENIDVLSRYGAADTPVALDKLGGVHWQARRARVKKRLKDMAEELLKVAAARELKEGEVFQPPPGSFDEFCARFPYAETEDQLRAIEDILDDFNQGKPMDRLVCGDVGFGKTEVALRAAFVAALSGVQVAVVAPTTLLCRQHYNTFLQRFKGLPVRIAQLSRFVSAKDSAATKEQLAAGKIDIVIGTHALLASSIKFKHLGLMIIDEEQHFGVKQKEKLKQVADNVHVLTLTATPIPRTLQLALSGVREMSLITTPPIDRLAVRTFVLPFDPVVIREALMREHLRGGQSFVVCPRIEDLPALEEELRQLVPEIKFITAHGQLSSKQLEDRIQAFCDGSYDMLVSTNIVESGLDIPRANTMVICRSNLFGLAQLYQLRGRIGRSKVRGYAYLTWPADQKLNRMAEERLKIIESLDTLGAGFQLATHDMDLRGGGNLLGEEQSGHIREVGIELFQQMLADAVEEARRGVGVETITEERWAPQINLGIPVLIPEDYITDLPVRMQLYRRLAEMDSPDAIEAFAAELINRFGTYPAEVDNLLQIMQLKHLCRTACIAKLDAGPKGAVLAFHNDKFPEVDALLSYVQKHNSNVKLRPDQKLVFTRTWETEAARMKGVKVIVQDLVGLLN